MRTSSVGPVIILVGSSAGATMLRSRISWRPTPSSRATTSNMRSRTQVSTAQGPRYAMYVALFDAVTVASNSEGAEPVRARASSTRMMLVNIGAPNGNPGTRRAMVKRAPQPEQRAVVA